MNLFEKLATKTTLNYAMVLIGALVIGRFGIDEASWKDISGIIVNVILPSSLAILGAVNGIRASLKTKVVGTDGKSVALPKTTADAISEAAQERPKTLEALLQRLNSGQ